MSSIYKYFNESKIKIDSFENALKRIETEKLIISSEHLPVLEAAERGDFYALCEMAISFSEGAKGIQPNYKLSKHYHKIIQEKNKGDPVTECDSHRSNAFLEMNFQNLDAAKYELVEAVKIMVNNLSLKEWNFNLLHNLEKILQYQAENQAQE